MLQYILLFAAFAACLLMSVTIAATALFDVRYAKRMHKHRARTKQNRRRPAITVFIYSHNNLAGLTKTMVSLKAVTYKKLEIVVVDAASKDGSARYMRAYIKDNPRKAIRLVARRKLQSYSEAAASMRTAVHGEYVVALRAGDTFAPQFFHDVAGWCNNRTNENAALLTAVQGPHPSMTNLLSRYWALFLQRQRKVVSILFSIKTATIQPGIAYEKTVFNKTVKYKNDTTVTILPTVSYNSENIQRVRAQSLIDAVRIRFGTIAGILSVAFISLSSAAVVIAISYSVYVAVALRQPELLVAVLAITATYFGHAIWNSELVSVLAKIKYTAGLPVTIVPGIISGLAVGIRAIGRTASGYRKRSTLPL